MAVQADCRRTCGRMALLVGAQVEAAMRSAEDPDPLSGASVLNSAGVAPHHRPFLAKLLRTTMWDCYAAE